MIHLEKKRRVNKLCKWCKFVFSIVNFVLLFSVFSSAIIDKVRNQEVPAFRPVLTFDSVEDFHGFDLIMQRCWTETPGDRPSFEEVAKMIKKLNTGK